MSVPSKSNIPHDPCGGSANTGDASLKVGISEQDEIYFRDVAPAVEFGCWVVVALAPFLRWVNGAAVTRDQFIIQVTLVALAVAGAIGLRIYNWRSSQSHRE